MSSASDKARFYLEQSVPELKELERKKIFSADEIANYARYVEFEINVDSLRRKRVKRLGIKAATHTGQRRIFFVLDRGTRKFPGDLSLWMQNIEFARHQKAYKKLSQILTHVLRLNPTKPELWIYAAKFASEENGDMTEARSFMHRGLRFCPNARRLWLEYARLEMIYIVKIASRREILGIGGTDKTMKMRDERDDLDADVLHFPTLTSEDIHPTLTQDDGSNDLALRNLDSTPALTGAIPTAIFDSAMIHFDKDPSLGIEFYELALGFSQLPCQRKILSHMGTAMMEVGEESWQAQVCHIRLPLVGISSSDVAFAAAMGQSLSRLKEGLSRVKGKVELASTVATTFEKLLEEDSLDPAFQRVIRSTLVTLKKAAESKN